MAKRITFVLLTVAGFGLVGSGVWFYARHTERLRSQGLDGLALLLLIFYGIFALMMPLELRSRWDRLTPGEMTRIFVMRGGLMAVVLGGIGLLILLIASLVMLPARLGHPYLILPWLTVLVPLALVAIDLYKGTYAPTPTNFGLGFLRYLFHIYGMLALQFTVIGVAFVLFPAGFFLQLLSIADLVARQLGRFAGELPLLCEWGRLESTACPPALVGFHLGHLLLALIAAQYGPSLFNKATDWYHAGLAWLTNRLER